MSQSPQHIKKQSFLEKFSGKKSVISREGLQHLLEMKQQSLGTSQPTQNKTNAETMRKNPRTKKKNRKKTPTKWPTMSPPSKKRRRQKIKGPPAVKKNGLMQWRTKDSILDRKSFITKRIAGKSIYYKPQNS